jgi:hypothetical protein
LALRQNVCTYLAHHFDLDQITPLPSNAIKFPLGSFSESSFELVYKKEKLAKIDEVFLGLMQLRKESGTLLIYSKLKFDMSKVSKWVRKTKGEISIYSVPQLAEEEKSKKRFFNFLSVTTDLGRLGKPIYIQFFQVQARTFKNTPASAIMIVHETFDIKTVEELRPSMLAAVLGDLWGI